MPAFILLATFLEVADGEITQASLNPVTTEQQSYVDRALQALDPDSARPECVMRSVNLNLGFSGRTVLNDVNVDLKRGSITALIGPTGSGSPPSCAPSTV